MSEKTGYLELILGPMFSGKTSYLIHLYEDFIKNGKKVSVINYVDDKRYNESMLSSHDKIMIPCVFTKYLRDADFREYDIVLINEGQFFTDLYEVVIHMVEVLNKEVYVCGLDSDFKRQKFGTILDLVPMCDNIVKLKSKCNYCSSSALFSHRLTQEKQQVVIGSSNYVPLCRNCYLS